MLAAIGHTFRLLRVAFTLARYDALAPSEYRQRMPAAYRLLGALLTPIVRARKPKIAAFESARGWRWRWSGSARPM